MKNITKILIAVMLIVFLSGQLAYAGGLSSVVGWGQRNFSKTGLTNIGKSTIGGAAKGVVRAGISTGKGIGKVGSSTVGWAGRNFSKTGLANAKNTIGGGLVRPGSSTVGWAGRNFSRTGLHNIKTSIFGKNKGIAQKYNATKTTLAPVPEQSRSAAEISARTSSMSLTRPRLLNKE